MFDLFKLHSHKEDNTPRKMIFVSGENLQEKVEEIINDIINKKSKEKRFIKLKRSCIKQLYEKALNKCGQQQILAQKLNVPRQSLYRWKESKGRIPYDVLVRLCGIANTNYYSLQDSIIDRKVVRKGITKVRITELLAKRLKTKVNFVERIIYKKREDVPLVFIIELLKLWKKLLNKTNNQLRKKKLEFHDAFRYLKQNGRAYKVNAIKELTLNLSKIIGSILADGCVVKGYNSIFILDEEKLNLEAFANWIYQTFNLLPKFKKVKNYNAWSIKVDSKVIKRYLTTFFEFSEGKKKPNYDIPKIIKDSTFEFQRACAYGTMCFDGVVRNKKEIGLNIGSKELRDSLYKIFTLDGLTVTRSNKPDRTGMWRMYSSGKFDKSQFEKWLNYFEPNTDRWFRIYEWINGFNKTVNNVQDARYLLMKYYPPKPNTKITVSDIFNLFVNKKAILIKDILNELKRQSILVNESTLWFYTGLLREMKIVNKIRLSDNKNLYVLNQNAKEWRLPNRVIDQQNPTN